MALQATGIGDMVIATQNRLGRGKITDLGFSIQKHVAFSTLFREKKAQFSGGERIQFQVMYDYGDQARNVGLFSTDNPDVSDGLTQGFVDWRQTETKYSFDQHEPAMQRGGHEIVSIIKTRRTQAFGALAARIETDFWSKPASSSDTTTPYGLGYWLVYNASTGFNGGNATGFSGGPAGLDASSASLLGKWANFTGQYTTVAKTDLVRTMRQCHEQCQFTAPVNFIPSYANGGDDWGTYTNYQTKGLLEELAEQQNDRNGNDVASKDGVTTFRSKPIVYVPQLDSGTFATADPVFMLNWAYIYPEVQNDWYMREKVCDPAPNQHNVCVTYVDLQFNHVCFDRRRQGLIAKSDPFA